MNYYLDTEFLEGTQKTMFGHTKPTIDLISIGIVSEDIEKTLIKPCDVYSETVNTSREYYAISKDFNLKEAWNRYQEDINPDFKTSIGDSQEGHYNPRYIRNYWIRENVLKPIWLELCEKDDIWAHGEHDKFTYSSLERLIKKYGKTNKQIAEEIYLFTKCVFDNDGDNNCAFHPKGCANPKFYGYYCNYDWVALCWLFGKMIDLPKGFPMYCIDLKQMLNEKVEKFHRNDFFTAFDFTGNDNSDISLDEKLKHIKMHVSYPKQTNEHHALEDAKWIKKLHEFINKL